MAKRPMPKSVMSRGGLADEMAVAAPPLMPGLLDLPVAKREAIAR
jgi:hypothetical protein